MSTINTSTDNLTNTTEVTPVVSNPAVNTNVTADKNDISGLNSILSSSSKIVAQGAQIYGAINQQRTLSGAKSNRQERLAKCGRKPLFGKKKKAEYAKCMAEANTPSGSGYDPNKSLSGEGSNKNMTYVLIGGAVLVIGGLMYYLSKRK